MERNFCKGGLYNLTGWMRKGSKRIIDRLEKKWKEWFLEFQEHENNYRQNYIVSQYNDKVGGKRALDFSHILLRQYEWVVKWDVDQRSRD